MDVIRWRRDLHRIPELGLVEYKTTAYLKAVLEEMGYIPENLLETGLYVYIDNGREDTVAFRCDIDGLEISEENRVDYASCHEGLMHACGHDGHMATMLGFAKRLKESKDSFPSNLLLLFQPAEESPGAAKFVVESGIFQRFAVKAIFGMHLMPSIPEGKIASKSRALMATCGELDVLVKGRSAHAGLYAEGIDSVVIASELILQYQKIISRMTGAFDPCLINIGRIEGGSARNIVADSTEFHGTVRAFSDEVFAHLVDKIGKMNRAAELSYGCEIEWTCPPLYPAVVNDEALYEKFKALCDENYMELSEPYMLAEDFSYYQKHLPGVFFYLGTQSESHTSGLHTGTFDFDETVLYRGVETYYRIALAL